MENKVKTLGTPNQKALYQRAGIILEGLMNNTFDVSIAREAVKVINAMNNIQITEIERAKVEIMLGNSATKIRELENKAVDFDSTDVNNINSLLGSRGLISCIP